MVTSILRMLCVSGFLIPLATAETAAPPEDCGQVFSRSHFRGAIYVSCPDLQQLSSEQALGVVISVLDGTDRWTGVTMILFFRDESVLERGWWPTHPGRQLESWGSAFVGVYHTSNQMLTVRSEPEGEWREIYLPTSMD